MHSPMSYLMCCKDGTSFNRNPLKNGGATVGGNLLLGSQMINLNLVYSRY